MAETEYVRTADDAARLSKLLRDGTHGRALVVASVARATGRSYVDETRLERALRGPGDGHAEEVTD